MRLMISFTQPTLLWKGAVQSVVILIAKQILISTPASTQDLTVMRRLRCLGSLHFAGLRPSARVWILQQAVRTDLLLRACWWDGWTAHSAGCRSQCRRSTYMWRAQSSPTATLERVSRTNGPIIFLTPNVIEFNAGIFCIVIFMSSRLWAFFFKIF